MKVLHLNDHYAPVGGAEVILFDVLEALEERGVVNVVAHQYPASSGRGRRAVQVPGLFDPDPAPEARAALRRILAAEAPDVVHLHGNGSGALLAAAREQAPVVQGVYNHAFYCPGGARYLPWRGAVCPRAFGALCLVAPFLTRCNSLRPRALWTSWRRSRGVLDERRGVRFLALSGYQAECLVRSGYPASAVAVLPPFADLPAFEEPAATDTVLFAGRLVREKGLDRLLAAMARPGTRWRLVVAGEGPGRAAAEALARRLGVAGRVEFRGWLGRAALAAAYAEAFLVAVPSVWPEPFGLVGLEAMSHARPVVAFDVGGVRTWLADGVTGLLAGPGDVEGLGQRIDYLVRRPAVARDMGLEGRRRVEREFSKEVYLERLLGIYREAGGRRRRLRGRAR